MCDTLVALPPATAGGVVVFGKNSDRPAGEGQSVVEVAGARHEPGATVRCTYIEIAQAAATHAVVLSQPDWMWGAEMGANEHGVVIGNEAVWTTEPVGRPALLGMDLLRLGLERGATAEEALDVIVDLLETHGQGGPCAEGDPSFTYHNSYLIADAGEAWVLETAGRRWAAERVGGGVRSISNELSIGRDHDRASAGLDGVDFRATFGGSSGPPDPDSRGAWSRRLLEARAPAMTPEAMMEILADHESGLCMHGSFETTASMVSELGPAGPRHWMTGAPFPCATPFRPVACPA